MRSGEAGAAFRAHHALHSAQNYPKKVARPGKPIAIAHPAREASFAGDAVVNADFQIVAYVPSLSSENLMGVMGVAARANGPFDEIGVLLLLSVGTCAEFAIENAGLQANARRLVALEEQYRIGMECMMAQSDPFMPFDCSSKSCKPVR